MMAVQANFQAQLTKRHSLEYSEICQNCGEQGDARRRTYKGIGVIYLCYSCRQRRGRDVQNKYLYKRKKQEKGLNKAKEQIFDERGKACERCGATGQGLQVHHKKRLADGGGNSADNLEILCTKCHRQEHYS